MSIETCYTCAKPLVEGSYSESEWGDICHLCVKGDPDLEPCYECGKITDGISEDGEELPLCCDCYQYVSMTDEESEEDVKAQMDDWRVYEDREERLNAEAKNQGDATLPG